MRKSNPSDISKEAFEQIRLVLESVRKRTKPRTVDLYETFCAVLYLLKSGCQWRMLPQDFPKWRTEHSYFAKWSEPDQEGVSALERALKKSDWSGLRRQGRSTRTSFLIVDAQSVKNASSAQQKGYDAGKKVSGIKRHIAVDTQGFPHAVAVTTADVTDRSGALQAMDRCAGNQERVRGVLVDGGYRGTPFADAVREKLGEKARVAKRNALHTFAVMPQRWIVEHSLGWLEQSRRLWKNPERLLNAGLQFIHLAFLSLLLKRLRTTSY
jgi:transposase